MMTAWRRGSAALILIGLAGAFGSFPAQAQMGDMGRSLGGYGTATIGSYYRSGGGPLIPYGGSQGGFVPYRQLEAPPAAVTLMPRSLPETPIGGAGLMMGTPIGGSSRLRSTDFYRPLNLRGAAGMGMGRAPSAMPGRYGPGFGSPFRRPPGLSGGRGSSMGSM